MFAGLLVGERGGDKNQYEYRGDRFERRDEQVAE